MVDDDRLPLDPGEMPRMLRVRFRTLGCYPLTGAIELDAETLDDIIAEMRLATTSERQGRLIDTDESGLDGEEEARGVLLMSDTSSAALPTLRLLTCGSVDDGKSTLIGRLLYEKKLIFDDQLTALERDSKKYGTTEDEIDFALLVDGLEAEREQGITIDVAYRYFATSARSFIVADTPGHEQYTRNMATGASNADLAIVLVDARKGLLTQTHRHSIIVSLLGVRHVVLAVNKIDLVGYDERTFATSSSPIASLPSRSGFARSSQSRFRPASATTCPQEARARPGIREPICSSISSASRSRKTGDGAISSAGSMDQPSASRFPGICRHDSQRPDRARRRRSSSPIPAAASKVASIYVADRQAETPKPATP